MEIEKKLEKIGELLNIQCSDGNWNYDPYQMGLANGMILIKSILEGTDANYLSRPDKFKNQDGTSLIAQERYEQINKHGFSLERDRKYYDNGELLQAARFCLGVDEWPENWDITYADNISGKDEIGKLKVAGSFIAAEMDRIMPKTIPLESQ